MSDSKPVIAASLVETLKELAFIRAHLYELGDAWASGALSSYDGKNGLRSNTNHDALLACQKAIQRLEKR